MRKNIEIGDYVKIVLKQNQRTGRLTDGYVKDILYDQQADRTL
jgi:uncharacterized repeat protein (TIGR03833 family)